MDTDNPNPVNHLQLVLPGLGHIAATTFRDPLAGWGLVDVRALAIDPDVELRRIAAQSNWNCDIRLQRVLACDPDETVVANLLRRVDPPLEVLQLIFAGPHTQARRTLAARNLPTSVLMQLTDDHDDEVRRSATCTLRRRGVNVDNAAVTR
jgi:hypothetical protein